MVLKRLTRGACAAVITCLLAACGGSGTASPGGGAGTGAGTGTGTGTPAIQGVAMPASVSVVTATHAGN
jgi:hypothetical protein